MGLVDSEGVDDKRHLGELVDSVSSGHDQRRNSGSGNSGSDGVSSLGEVHFSVPSSPGDVGVEHSSTSAHVTEGSLSRSVGSTSSNSGNSGHSSSGTPGGHLGRLIIWTRPAFERLDHIFGTFAHPGQGKKGYVLERPLLTNANLARLINSNEIQSVVRSKQRNVQVHDRQKKNPLKNKAKMDFLNPYDKVRRQREQDAQNKNKTSRAERKAARAKQRKTFRKAGRKFIATYNQQLNGAHAKSEADYKDYIKSTKVGKDAMKDVEA